MRKLVGLTALVIWVVVYAFVAAVIGDFAFAASGVAARLVYFAVAGLAWTIPAAAIIWWVYRAPSR